MTLDVKPAMIRCRRMQSAHIQHTKPSLPHPWRGLRCTWREVVTMPSAGSTAARGYGQAHEQQRRAWAPKVKRGEAYCARCKEPIAPDAAWDLGHSDDRTKWTGPEHQGCNRRAGAANSHAVRKGLRHSRTW